ncbi:MAG: hypothetical protein WD043_07540 [Gemmatimonadales bacterium]
MSHITIVCPGFPDLPGGVTDHTARLKASWEAAGHAVAVVSDASLSAPETDAQLIQYVPFLYGRRGLSPHPERLARAARQRGVRVVVFVHEPWVPMTRLPWLVLGPLQRRQLLRLLRHADVTVTAVPAWQRQLGGEVDVVYVGSNLGTPPERVTPTLPAPVVFSPFAAGLAWDWAVAAINRIAATPPLIVLGADDVALAAHPATRRLDRTGWEARGRLDGPATLELLRAAPLVLAPFVDGITGRRTSVAAALSTGARVVGSRGHLFDPVFGPGLAGVAATREAFGATALRLWRQDDQPEDRARRTAWYATHLDSVSLDTALLRLLVGNA